MVRSFLAGLFARAPRTTRDALVSRLALERLEIRDVPASLFWTDATTNPTAKGDFYTPANWFNATTGMVATQPPQIGDDVTFSGTYSAHSNDNCTDLGFISGSSGGGT